MKRSANKMAGEPFKVWKSKPPGPEQLELERMFSDKEIDANDSPDSVRQRNPIFHRFPSHIFGAHFRKTKAVFGLFG